LSLLAVVQIIPFVGGPEFPKNTAPHAITHMPMARVAAPRVSDDMEGLPSVAGEKPGWKALCIFHFGSDVLWLTFLIGHRRRATEAHAALRPSSNG
jgi:hypothetical protein